MRGRSLALVALFGVSGCGILLGTSDDSAPFATTDAAGGDGAASGDAPFLGDGGAPDADAALFDGPCDPAKPFGAPTLVAGLDTANVTFNGAWPFGDTEIFFSQREPTGTDTIERARRASPADPYMNPSPVSTPTSARHPTLSADGLVMYYEGDPGDGGSQIFSTTRPSTVLDFTAVPEAHGGATAETEGPFLAGDQLWFSARTTLSQGDIYRSAIPPTVSDPTLVTSLGGFIAAYPVPNADGKRVYLASTRPPNLGGLDVWTATLGSNGIDYDTPTRVDELSTASNEYPAWLSPDGCSLLLLSDRGRGNTQYAVFRATKPR